MATLKVKYSELFSLSIQQPYYENGVSRDYKVAPTLDYTIRPTEQCMAVLNRLNMFMKPNPAKGGFTVWCRTNGTSGPNEVLYFIPRKGDMLTFVVTLVNPDFLNHNNLPVQQAIDQIYYFNNQVVDAAATRDHLHLNLDTTGVSLNDILKKVSGSYSYVHGTTVATDTAKLKHVASGFELLPSSLLNEGGQTYLMYDLSGFPAGKCELLIGGVVEETAYHLKEDIEAPVFAILEFSLTGVALPNYRIIEDDGTIVPQRPKYTLLFENRAVLWKYKVLLETNSPLYKEIDALSDSEKADFLNRFNIASNDTAVIFSTNVISDKHFEFISTDELPLLEKYSSSSSPIHASLSLNLKKYIGIPARESDVKINLPYPSAGQLDASGDPVVYSNVLITL